MDTPIVTPEASTELCEVDVTAPVVVQAIEFIANERAELFASHFRGINDQTQKHCQLICRDQSVFGGITNSERFSSGFVEVRISAAGLDIVGFTIPARTCLPELLRFGLRFRQCHVVVGFQNTLDGVAVCILHGGGSTRVQQHCQNVDVPTKSCHHGFSVALSVSYVQHNAWLTHQEFNEARITVEHSKCQWGRTRMRFRVQICSRLQQCFHRFHMRALRSKVQCG